MDTGALRQLEAITDTWGLALSAQQIGQFATYAAELQQWNKQLNLTTVTTVQDIITRHFLDSLWCARSWGAVPENLVDIGSGAGFPGLPLKILVPDLALTLIESIEKKAVFLRHLIEVLGLRHTAVLALRAEQVGRDPAHREQYAVATGRAVADLRVLAEYSLPLLRIGGRLLAHKGPHSAAEVAAAAAAIDLLGGQLQAIEPVLIAGEPARTLVVVDKIVLTPERYPRAAGIPAKRPLPAA